jgi:uncharacterized protein YjbI with pentapeptide repeats
MANDEHVAMLKQGVTAWNAWRRSSDIIRPDLSNTALSKTDLSWANLRAANLREADLSRVDLSRAKLSEADLSGANLTEADLSEANLENASLHSANLFKANLTLTSLGGVNLVNASLVNANLFKAQLFRAALSRANLREANLEEANLIDTDLCEVDLSKANLVEAYLYGANLFKANLHGADLRKARLAGTRLCNANLGQANLEQANLESANLSGADLSGANLSSAYLDRAILVETNLTDAFLTCCRIYGISAWNVSVSESTLQQDLIITAPDEADITVDNIEVAQFVHLLLRNQKIRDVIDTITSKAVLILGRFTEERKAVLNALREELRKRDYLPILFDFEKPRGRDTDETITLLARMARFVVADISDAKAVLQELRAIVPDLPSVPVQPIILEIQEESGMFDFYRNRPSFLPVHRYADQEQLLADLSDKMIRPAELKVRELRG